MTRRQRTLIVAARRRRHRHRRQRERGCVLLAVVGLGRARVPRADDRAPDPRSGVAFRAVCGSRSPRHGRARSVDRAVDNLVDQHVGFRAGGRADARLRRACARGRAGAPARRRSGVFAGALVGITVVSATGSPRGCSRIGSTRSTIRSTRTGSPSRSGTGTRSALSVGDRRDPRRRGRRPRAAGVAWRSPLAHSFRSS